MCTTESYPSYATIPEMCSAGGSYLGSLKLVLVIGNFAFLLVLCLEHAAWADADRMHLFISATSVISVLNT